MLNLITYFVSYTNFLKWISPRTMRSETILLKEIVSPEGILSYCDSENSNLQIKEVGIESSAITFRIMSAHDLN